MGLFKLALIGGAAYYAGKKFNENHQGQEGGCCGGWKRKHQNQPDPKQGQFPGQGMTQTRDIQGPTAIYDNTEKAPLQPEYPAGYSYGYAYAQPQPQDSSRDTKTQMVKVEGVEDAVMTPPAYGNGYGRPLSPQERMFPQGIQGQGQAQLSRAGSPQQQQQVQQMTFGEPKRRYVVEQPTWK